jgi:hypothetical protein
MGAFAIDVPANDPENFNLRPIVPDPLPDDQEKISHEVYRAINILKLLRARGVFRNDDAAYAEFVTRIIQVARVGCVDDQVHPALATTALEQIRTDIVRRKGATIIFGFLQILAWCALGGAAIGAAIEGLARTYATSLTGYGLVIIGSMVGAWVSVAASRGEISFDGLQDFVERRHEPFIRMLFVAAIASIFALFLQLKILSLSIGTADLATFASSVSLALVLGLVSGVGEKALSVRVLDRTRNILGT